MNHGLKPIKKDRRDYSFHKTFGAASLSDFLAEYNCDAGLTMPDQNEPNPMFGIAAQLYGCTNYTQCELGTDEDGVPYNPGFTESKTHANEKGGLDIRVSLSSVCKDGMQALGEGPEKAPTHKRPAYFNVDRVPGGDWFDSIRSALWMNRDQKRSISIGTPWYPEFEYPQAGIVPTPNYAQNVAQLPWHNWKIAGWKTIGGVPYLIGKTWQGPGYGDRGYAYFSRETINAVLNIQGTGAFTVAKPTGGVVTVQTSIIEQVILLLTAALGLLKGLLTAAPAPVPVPAPAPVPVQPEPTAAERLYATGKAALGEAIAPRDIAELGCAYTVDEIYHRTFGRFIGKTRTLSTAQMYQLLKVSPDFVKTTVPTPGCIIISPTGMGKLPHGHVGIIGKTSIMSNDSSNGRWGANYTLDSWVHSFREIGGFPIFFFLPK